MLRFLCVKTNLKHVKYLTHRFAKLGLEIHITELDIKCTPQNSGLPCTPNLLNAQAAVYAGILKTCLDQPKCTSFETWGQ